MPLQIESPSHLPQSIQGAGDGSRTQQARQAPVIRVEGLTAGYGRRVALEGITFAVGQGELVGLVGPNGSGKSTLIKTLIGLRPPWRGLVEVLGGTPAQSRGRIGYMPQVESVDWAFPITVREVVAMGLYRPRWGWARLRGFRDASRPAVEGAMERLGIGHLAARQTGELSLGQQRRVLLARTLVKDPQVLLLDEPAAGLDVAVEHDLMEVLVELARQGKTMIVATHDLTSVYEFYSASLCINRHMLAYGPPREALTEDVLVRTFGRHLLVFHRGEHGYTAEPHVHHGVHEHD